MSDLRPCPFCNERLEKSDVFSNRTADYYVHPDNDCFLAGIAKVIVSDRPEGQGRAAKWNSRPDWLSDATDEEFDAEVSARIRAGTFNPGDWVDPDEWVGTLQLPYAGEVALNVGALDEAIARLRRREPREALYQLEKAMDGHLDGLSDLKPQDLA